MAHTIDELREKQALPLSIKIALTRERIRAWVREFGEEGVYISFSGGKDSTVLLDIVRNVCGYKEVPAVFVDTGLEYPEIREFVKTFDNVTIIKPKMNFKQVIEQYGYPFISKEVSGKIYEARNKEGGYAWQVLHGGKNKGTKFDITKWLFLLDSPFKINSYCCNVMKKNPTKKYEHETGRFAFTATMASESKVRTTQWLIYGCNGFDKKRPVSNPMSFWTEQDVLLYIKQNKLPICSVYGEIIEDRGGTDEVENQTTISDWLGEEYKSFDASPLPLKTTGCNRTGCMFCGFGCHLEKEGEGRFEKMKQTHPKQYEWIMKPWEEGGLGYKEVIDWINEHGNLHIKY